MVREAQGVGARAFVRFGTCPFSSSTSHCPICRIELALSLADARARANVQNEESNPKLPLMDYQKIKLTRHYRNSLQVRPLLESPRANYVARCVRVEDGCTKRRMYLEDE
jgi:hypothetical protein